MSPTRSRRPVPDPAIDSIIAELPRDMGKIAKAVRSVIWETAPGLEECVKWNAPNWKGNSLVLCLMVYPDHLNLGFWRGADLAASSKLVEGTGKSLRHVKLKDAELAQSSGLKRLIRDAVALDRGT